MSNETEGQATPQVAKSKSPSVHFEFTIEPARSVFRVEVTVKRPKRMMESAGTLTLNADELAQLQRDLQGNPNYSFIKR